MTSNTRTPKTIPAMAAPLKPPDFLVSLSFDGGRSRRWCFSPGGGGGAVPEDQEFPPVLQKN